MRVVRIEYTLSIKPHGAETDLLDVSIDQYLGMSQRGLDPTRPCGVDLVPGDKVAALNPRQLESLLGRRKPGRTRPGKTKTCGHINQLSQRVGVHFPHHAATMGFHRNLADAQFTRNLLIQEADDH